MNLAAEKIQNGLPIGAVERETGISKDTLRAWEKRYGFPQPLRDAFNERIYPFSQIERLKLIQRLIQHGHRPHKIAHLSEAELKEILAQKFIVTPSKHPLLPDPLRDITMIMVAIKKHDADALHHEFQQRYMRLGLQTFIIEIVAPVIRAVGDAWERGDFEVFEEHFFTHCISDFLRGCIASINPPPSKTHPKVLLTTLPQELHGLGLLMVEALLTLEGCQCVSLGTQTPIGDIVYAAQAFKINAVALSFTSLQPANTAIASLEALRHELPPEIQIWIGGSCTGLAHHNIPHVSNLTDLLGLKNLITEWQQRNPIESDSKLHTSHP